MNTALASCGYVLSYVTPVTYLLQYVTPVVVLCNTRHYYITERSVEGGGSLWHLLRVLHQHNLGAGLDAAVRAVTRGARSKGQVGAIWSTPRRHLLSRTSQS
jgi:hypothetical protein